MVSFVTGVVVAAGGRHGFIGFIVPHIIRILVGADHRRVFPLSFIGGSLFLLWMDVLARTIMAPKELAVGIFTAFCGGPFFVLAALPQEQIRQDVRWFTMEHKIEIRDLHYRVPTREILHDVSLQVDKNQFVGLIGPNGSGKTTLLKHIYRALPPEKSTVFINGREIEAFSYRETAGR